MTLTFDLCGNVLTIVRRLPAGICPRQLDGRLHTCLADIFAS